MDKLSPERFIEMMATAYNKGACDGVGVAIDGLSKTFTELFPEMLKELKETLIKDIKEQEEQQIKRILEKFEKEKI